MAQRNPASPAGAAGMVKIRAGGSGMSSMVAASANSANPPPPRGTAAAAAASLAAGKSVAPAPAPAAGSSSGSAAAAGASPPKRQFKLVPSRSPAAAAAASTPATRIAAATSGLAALAAATPYKRPAAAGAGAASTASNPPAVRATSSADPARNSAGTSSTNSNASNVPLSNTTPHGISLDLSGDNAGPQLIASRTRSERLRQACRDEDALEVAKLLSGAAGANVPGGAADPNQPDPYGTTALMIAAGAGADVIVEELLHAGANVHAKDKYGQTALHYACSAGSYPCAALLLERKAGANVASGAHGGGHTPLMKAAYVSHPHAPLLADLLLIHRAKPDVQTAGSHSSSGEGGGVSAASIAVEQGHLEVLRVLAHYGASMTLTNPSTGDSLLHLAARKSAFTMIAHLVALGADPAATNRAGHTAGQVKPDPQPGAGALPPGEFAKAVEQAVQRGMALREAAAAERAENARIIKEVKQRRAEEARAAAAAANGTSSQPISQPSSRPSSAGRLTAEELKARTYKPKLDPTSVFGDALEVAPPAAATSASSAASASAVSASSASAPARELTQEEQDALDDEEDRLRRQHYAAQDSEDDDTDEPPLSYHDLLQLRGQGARALAAASTTAPVQSSAGGGLQGTSASAVPARTVAEAADDEEEMQLVDRCAY